MPTSPRVLSLVRSVLPCILLALVFPAWASGYIYDRFLRNVTTGLDKLWAASFLAWLGWCGVRDHATLRRCGVDPRGDNYVSPRRAAWIAWTMWVADWRLDLRRYVARVVEGFAHRVRSEVNLPDLDRELRSVAAETMHPATVSRWLPEAVKR